MSLNYWLVQELLFVGLAVTALGVLCGQDTLAVCVASALCGICHGEARAYEWPLT